MACTMVINIETLNVFKGAIYKKKIVEPFLRKETHLAHKPNSNRRLIFYYTNSSFVLSIWYVQAHLLL